MKIIETRKNTLLVEMSKSEVCLSISTNEDDEEPSLNRHTVIPYKDPNDLDNMDRNTLFLMSVSYFCSDDEFVNDMIEKYKKINNFSPQGVFKRLHEEEPS